MGKSTTLAQFNANLDTWIGKTVPGAAIAAQKRLTFMALGCAFLDSQGNVGFIQGVLQFTPVDTGRARGNWQVSAGEPAFGEVPGEWGTKREARKGALSASFVGAPASGDETGRAQSALAGLQFGQRSYISNSLPYIAILNDGGTNRVAHHMVERAVANVRGAVA